MRRTLGSTLLALIVTAFAFTAQPPSGDVVVLPAKLDAEEFSQMLSTRLISQKSESFSRAMEERLLEIGPGIGTHALPIAAALGPDGILEVLEVQRKVPEEVAWWARAAGITNIAMVRGDAAHLPYPDRTFDGAYLIGVLGEIPDGNVALREVSRILKPDGRLVVGELFVDLDFVPLRALRVGADESGFVFRRKAGGARTWPGSNRREVERA